MSGIDTLSLVEKIADIADVSGHRVLNPWAGTGELADALRNAGAEAVVCIEKGPQGVQALMDKDHHLIEANFFDQVSLGKPYERIVMQLPTDGYDYKFVMHALTFLAQKGRLVAACSYHRWFMPQKAKLHETLFINKPNRTFTAERLDPETSLIVIS
jgi:hypothetical protein